jgi:phosphoribosylaminoimidazolecarboxamide formyltransferase/IMP cyclohydrolase
MPGSQEANVAGARQLHGKELSFNNLNDTAAALELVKEFSVPAVAVIKHTNPCGCAVGDGLALAFERAYAGDPLAAFGGIVALNRTVDHQTAKLITGPDSQGNPKFLEVVIAAGYDDDALAILRDRWKNVRLLAVGDLPGPDQRDSQSIDLKSIIGGVLAQSRDLVGMTPDGWELAAGPAPDDQTSQTLHVGWCAAKHVKSNAIVLARDGAVVGVGAGQMDRVESCKIAVAKASVRGQDRSQGAVAASDAFFPFRDGPDVLIGAGVKAIVQPGGSKRDDQTIAACNEAGVSLLFTGRRHFRH